MKVLVVEDDLIAQRILQRAVEKLGHECTVLGDGDTAWERHRSIAPDVIISGWMMPGITGLELCKRIRQRDAEAYTYFVFITALDDKQSILQGMEAGADDYITKPFEFEQLQARLIAASRVTTLHQKLNAQKKILEQVGRESFEAARTDALTLVGNRLRLREDLDTLRARARRYRHQYCAALCDVDFFKKYNDHHGHLAGDEALKRVASTIREELRGGDTVYRYGGEEFLVIFPEQSAEGAAIGMDRIRRAVEAQKIPNDGREPPGPVTISAGIAVLLPGSTKTTDDWLKNADEALYRAKNAGRNRVAVFGAVDSLPPPAPR